MHKNISISRREFIKALTASATALNLSPQLLSAASADKIIRKIPSTREELAIMGVGSSQTFDISVSKIGDSELLAVIRKFFDDGGQCIDSSPMYGNAETVIGELLTKVNTKQNLFAATKVWTDGRENGIRQMNRSMQRMGVNVMDLMQIHNLRDWKVHLKTLQEWKEEGKIRYIGITTYNGLRHEELGEILRKQPMDFVQFTYNIENLKAEQSLFPIARDRGIATLINVPFQAGRLFRKVRGKQLPDWVTEFDCVSWGQFFLKFIASHPDVTCIIPATSKLKHMADNMAAGFGRLPDTKMRQRMIDYME